MHHALSSPRRRVQAAVFAGALATSALIVGCGADELTGSSTCSDYLDADRDTRHDAAAALSVDARTANPGDTSWGPEMDRLCNLDNDQTLDEAFRESAAEVTAAEAEILCRTAQTAFQAFRAAEGAYPATLDELTPEYLRDPLGPEFELIDGELICP